MNGLGFFNYNNVGLMYVFKILTESLILVFYAQQFMLFITEYWVSTIFARFTKTRSVPTYNCKKYIRKYACTYWHGWNDLWSLISQSLASGSYQCSYMQCSIGVGKWNVEVRHNTHNNKPRCKMALLYYIILTNLNLRVRNYSYNKPQL